MNAAAVALEALLDLLELGDVPASRDASAFYPAPIGVLLGLPTKTGARQSGAATFEVPILVISADPMNTPEAVDQLYSTADAISELVRTRTYRPTTWDGGSNDGPLPAIEILAIVSAEEA